jgi:hypothetical protein
MDSENMPNSAAKQVIDTYLQQVDPGYALLLDAPWGSGKTYLIKKVTNCEADPTRLYVTLFDVDSSAAFEWALVRAINPWAESSTALWGKRLKEIASSISIFGNSVDLTKVNLTEIVLRELPETLIFDDIERCSLDHKQLSGLINRFVEHQKKRVILIANSDQLKEKSAFDTSREKLIGQTITLRPDLDAAMVAVWGKIPDGQGRKALQSRQGLIAKTFNEADHQNLRLLLRSMRDAAAMLDVITPEMLTFDVALDCLITTFLALHMAYHGRRLSKQDMLDRAKFRRSVNSNSTENEETVDGLAALQANHPDCSIESIFNQILPVDLGYALIVDGYASRSVIVNDLSSTHQFTTPADKPDWLRLWQWTDEPVHELEGVIHRLTAKIETLEITEPGEVLQLYAASKRVAGQNGIGLSEDEVAEFFRKYIRSLAKQEKIPARVPSSYDEDGRYGYGDENHTCTYQGFAFNISKSDRRIIDLMQAQQDDALARKMPEYATELMGELSKDFSAFKDRFKYPSQGANFSETPILHYMNIDDAVEIFLEIFNKDKDEAKVLFKLLGKRRAEHRIEMKEEWDWIDKFKETSIRKAYDHSKLLGAQIAQYFQWFSEAR